MEWSTACLDWRERLVSGQSIIPPPIYRDAAEYAVRIFKGLRITDIPGKPTFGECCEEWVFDLVRAIFGGYDAETGDQLIREYGLLISKKNTKSTVGAAIMLTATIVCWRNDEEHLILAPTKEVADNSFKPAASMVRADPNLSSLFQVQDHLKTITHRATRNSLKVVAADTDTVSGKKAGRILVDELWVFGKHPRAAAMFMEALGGQVSRPEGFVVYLTTQSDEPPAGVFKEKLEYWRQVRDGKIHDPKTLPILYEFPEEMVKEKAYLKPENFRITNPNMGRSVSQGWISDQIKRLAEGSPEIFQQFLAKHLNIEMGMNLREGRWCGADFWQACAKPGNTLDDLLKRSEVVVIGIDGGGLDDMLGLAILGRTASGKWLHWGKAWLHPIALERRKSEAARYQDFAKVGDLTITEEIGEDIQELTAIVKKVEETGLLDRIGVDPVGISAIVDSLTSPTGANIQEDRIVGIPQGWKMVASIKMAERQLSAGEFEHCDQPLMAWCMGNAKVEQRGNALLITKQAAGYAKIDPVIAMLNAVTLMGMNPKPRKKLYQAFIFG